MIKLGEKQELVLVKQMDFGVYLSDPCDMEKENGEQQRVLLPIKQVPQGSKQGDRIQVFIPDPQVLDIQPENIPLDILYEDEDIILVNKPKGMVVHPAAGH